MLPGTRTVSLPDATRFSIIPFSDLKGLDLENVRWPLIARNVPLGSTLTLSNIALGPVTIGHDLSARSAQPDRRGEWRRATQFA